MDIYEPLDNKYTKWYNSIICKAKKRNWNKGLKTGNQSEEVKKRTSEAVKKWWKLRKENAINTNMQSKEN